MIVIIDYGMGNIHSVANALEAIDCDYIFSKDPEVILKADGLILPGVGAFDECMENLRKQNLITVIKDYVAAGKPILGICLGMQVLFEKGYEGHECDGLGFLKGSIRLMEDPDVKIPHIGWNRLEYNHKDEMLEGYESNPFMYFVHSYCATDYDDAQIMTISEYGSLKIPGYVRNKNVFGCQFHPEKSGKDGIAFLRKFKEKVYENMASN